MKIFRDLNSIRQIPQPVLTIGTFDGVHKGHQKIIDQLNYEAKKINGESVLLTFDPHPRMVLYPENHGLQLIQTQDEKLEKLEKVEKVEKVETELEPELEIVSSETPL